MATEKAIIYSKEFQDITEELTFILYDFDYFGFPADAEIYVGKILAFIEKNIETYPTKNTPVQLAQYGEKYLIYNANNHTTWYIFFSQIEQTYFVKFITNNHTEIIKDFNL